MRFDAAALSFVLAAQAALAPAAPGAEGTVPPGGLGPADVVYRHGFIYTVDAKDSVQQALAVRGGLIVYVGSDAGAAALVGANTRQIDLHGRMMMPGLVDGHMHPLDGGASLLKCNLQYLQLTIAQMQAGIQKCLDQTAAREPDAWLEVVDWFQEGMIPAGIQATRAALDALKTQRPILVTSSFGHTSLVNSRAIRLAGITASTQAPLGGKIWHDAKGDPTGLLEDAAQDLVTKLLPTPTPGEDVRSALAALEVMRKQGITTFLDALALDRDLAAFAGAERAGTLTARAHFAVLITPPEGTDPEKAVAAVTALARRYDEGGARSGVRSGMRSDARVGARVEPSLTVRNVKLFLDGVISAPALTGAMLEPYFEPVGEGAKRRWAPGKNRGPDVYFPAPVLRALIIAVAGAGFEPHMHADGDRAVHEGLDAIEALRARFPDKDIRAAIAHDEIVDPRDFSRFKQLNAIPVLSFQWEKQASDTVDNARDYMGPARYKYIEPAAFLADAGARIAFGSDWPVDPLDEWFALKVGVTRTNSPASGPKYAGRRLSADAGLSRAQVLRAITLNSSYELHQDQSTGSLEVGKFADLIVLDRNVLEVPAEEIAETKVLQTMVGGRVVHEADPKL
jgi:predicted amidohydrolase YtcJ